jgi:predicted nucleic acid-binding protein
MAKTSEVICIDSCVLISFLQGGKDRTTEDKALLKGFFSNVHDASVHVIFPTLLRAELLQCHLGPDVLKEFNDITQLPNFDEIPVNKSISTLASEIRSHYVALHKKNKTVSVLALADSIFIATAIDRGCGTLYTYDGDRLPPKKPRHLLSLKTPIAGKYPLHIRKPNSVQLGM